MAGRIAIPLHDGEGRHIGYAGLLVDENATVTSHRMLYPADREHDGVLHAFRKSILLYNTHNLKLPLNTLIVVEKLEDTWGLWQAGFQNVVSLLDQDCTSEQANMIEKLLTSDGQVWLFMASERAALAALKRLAPRCLVRWAKLDPGTVQHPTDQLKKFFD